MDCQWLRGNGRGDTGRPDTADSSRGRHVGAAYAHSSIVVATDDSLKTSGVMETANVAKADHLLTRSVVFGQPSLIRPELTRNRPRPGRQSG